MYPKYVSIHKVILIPFGVVIFKNFVVFFKAH